MYPKRHAWVYKEEKVKITVSSGEPPTNVRFCCKEMSAAFIKGDVKGARRGSGFTTYIRAARPGTNLYDITDIQYCPFCGACIEKISEEESERCRIAHYHDVFAEDAWTECPLCSEPL